VGMCHSQQRQLIRIDSQGPMPDRVCIAFARVAVRVIPRRIATLLLWLGLVALAAPALACGSMTTPTRDCCPEGAPAPCKNPGERGAVQCCVSVPTSSAVAFAMPARTSAEPLQSSGSPDPLVIVAWLATVRAASVDSIPTSLDALPRSRDGTHTYLRTGRLRL
jgi:hypothetical protein